MILILQVLYIVIIGGIICTVNYQVFPYLLSNLKMENYMLKFIHLVIHTFPPSKQITSQQNKGKLITYGNRNNHSSPRWLGVISTDNAGRKLHIRPPQEEKRSREANNNVLFLNFNIIIKIML